VGQDAHVDPAAKNTPRSVAEYRATIAALVPTLPVVRRPLLDCVGLVLGQDLVSPVALPPFDNSAMDGYAVRAEDVARVPVTLPVPVDIPAGRTDIVPLAPDTAHRIMTGAPVPPGADAVVRVEDTDGGVHEVTVRASVAAGNHIRRAGEDVTAGATVLRAGTVLGAPQLGLAAAIGCGTLPVHRPARVLILSTGSELVAADTPLRHGQIYESNSVMLAAAVREIGAEPVVLRFVPDDVETFHAAIAEHKADVDVLITSGGVSAGAYEVVKDALTGQGVEFVRVAVQPGGPQGSGLFGELPVATLPGNPVSSALSFELFLRPALLAAMGHTVTERPRVRARSTAALRSPAGRSQYRRGWQEGEVVTPVGGPGSHLLASLAISNCLIELPEDVTDVAEGDLVTVLRIEQSP
jgi:molybdopterin molybdotransferase